MGSNADVTLYFSFENYCLSYTTLIWRSVTVVHLDSPQRQENVTLQYSCSSSVIKYLRKTTVNLGFSVLVHSVSIVLCTFLGQKHHGSVPHRVKEFLLVRGWQLNQCSVLSTKLGIHITPCDHKTMAHCRKGSRKIVRDCSRKTMIKQWLQVNMGCCIRELTPVLATTKEHCKTKLVSRSNFYS